MSSKIKILNPEIEANILIYGKEKGGLLKDIDAEFFQITFLIKNEYYTGRILLYEIRKLPLDQLIKNVPIKFIAKEKIKKKVNVGDVLVIWSGKKIGEAVVTNVL